MAPASIEVRKSGKKKRSAQKEAEPEKVSHKSEVEMQIQSEMERSQRGNLTRGTASGPGKRGSGRKRKRWKIT